LRLFAAGLRHQARRAGMIGSVSTADSLPHASSRRLDSIDLLRGAVMIVMLLDHARDFIHSGGLTVDPTAAATTTPLLYLTRWITHLCAPTFVLLAGVSVRLQSAAGRSPRELSGYLLRRGAFLVALELIVLRPLIWFQLDYSLLAHLQVIWVIGWSMICMAGLVHLSVRTNLLFAVALIAGHNLLDGITVDWFTGSAHEILWVLLHQRAIVTIGDRWVLAQYPLVPWVGVMALGYALGGFFALEPGQRRRLLARTGLGLVVLFVLLRWTNLYGDLNPWSAQEASWRTLASFFAVEKYPPSLLFLCITLGPALLFLALADGRRAGPLARAVILLGRVPLFFYVLQWPTVHLLSRLFQVIDGQPVGWDSVELTTFRGLPQGCGFSLGAVYLAWFLGLVALYPLCRWYAGFKRAHPDWRILSYL
jgi:uncharacterized membrane protein